MKLFKEELKKLDIPFKKIKKYYEKYSKSSEEFEKIVLQRYAENSHNPRAAFLNTISGLFEWDRTPEGYTYWYLIANQDKAFPILKGCSSTYDVVGLPDGSIEFENGIYFDKNETLQLFKALGEFLGYEVEK